jgi:hypothetical protein
VTPVERGELADGLVEADLESLDLAQPSVELRLGEAFAEIGHDHDQPRACVRVHAQAGAADAPLTELTAEFRQLLTLRCSRADSLPA